VTSKAVVVVVFKSIHMRSGPFSQIVETLKLSEPGHTLS